MKTSVSLQSVDGHTVHGTLTAVERQRGVALLVHGITADRHEWGFFDFLVDELTKVGFSSLAIDYRGHGQSSMPIKDLALSGVVLDIAASWAHLTHTTEAPLGFRTIIGNSFGGGLSLLFGSLLTDVDRIIATCPVMSYVDDLTRVNEDWSKELSAGTIKYASKRLSSAVVPEMYLFDQMLESCGRTTPLTIVHGSADSDVPLSASESYLALRGSGELLVLEGMDHSFSAPEGTPDASNVSAAYRLTAAREVASLLAKAANAANH
jgi:pimeloyl-ACP methyl ester carboxylesterase